MIQDQTVWVYRFGWVAALGTAIASSPIAVQAQITPDNTLGAEASTVGNGVVDGNPVPLIEGGAARGSNLFHSFSEFNVGTGEAVYFGNPAGIENILSRVTGGNLSNIDGILGVDGGANLFLLNPNGIVFGPNAQLDIAGSFTASAGHRFAFVDGSEFSATSPQSGGLLTVSVPLGVQLNDAAQGDIVNQGVLRIFEGQNLTLFGNRVENRGTLLARGSSDIVLATPQTAGSEVLLNGGSVSINVLILSPLGGGNVLITTHNLTVQNDGAIATRTLGQVDSGQIQISATGDVIVENGGSIETSTFVLGNSGPIQISATGNVVVEGEGSTIASTVQPNAVGDSGGIEITTTNLSVLDAAAVNARTRGRGSSGQVQISATGNVVVEGEGSTIASTVGEGAVGDSGGIKITTTNLSVLDAAAVNASTSGQGNSGRVEVAATGDVVVAGNDSFIVSQVGEGAVGDSGGIEITTANLSVLNDGSVSASTFGQGNAGRVEIEAIDNVVVQGTDNGDDDRSFIVSQVAPGAAGNSGGIAIITTALSVLNDASVSASTRGQGNSGRVEIEASDVVVEGERSIISSQVNSGAEGDSGGVDITTHTLSVLDNAAVSARTLGTGDAGPMRIEAGEITLASGNSEIISDTRSDGDGGGLQLVALEDALTISGPGRIAVETRSTGQAGNIEVTAERFTLADGVTLSASTTGPSIGGNITVTADETTLRNGSQIAVNSSGTGQGGNLTLTGEQLTLEDRSLITAETASTDGGNLTFTLDDYLLLRDGSTISTDAGTDAAGGNGGNITLNLTDGFIVAVPEEDSDITANAFAGDGGNVTVTARSLLGIAFRPQETPLSDITASSQFGNSGTVSITELSPDVFQEGEELPVETAPPPLAAGCRAPGAQSGSFVITGRGGLPTNPIDVLEADSIWQDLAPLTETDEVDASSTLPAAEPEVAAPNAPLVQAQGWTRNADGTVTLLAHRSETPAPFETPQGCESHHGTRGVAGAERL
ncbi:MAG: filamentous hemagglutinin N-terminal domain-containing protein [Leptolyngbya sp. SIO1E4]|nr:filamentous hemagglutinin N-terminal domain-containing protein [Leptolyngbya sp. SIO1E4]